MNKLGLIKPLNIQIANVHQIPHHRVRILAHDVLKNTIAKLMEKLNAMITTTIRTPLKAYNRCFRNQFQFYLQIGQQLLVRDLLRSQTFTIETFMPSFENMMYNYRYITRTILNYVRQTPMEIQSQDRFYEIHLENMMSEVLQTELNKISSLLNEYKESQGRMNYPYKLVEDVADDYSQHELTATLISKIGPNSPRYLINIVNKYWQWRSPLLEIQRHWVPLTRESTNKYSIHDQQELNISFRMDPMRPTASRYHKSQRIRIFKQNQKILETQNYQDRLDFGEAFAKRIKLLIIEIAFDMPHLDIRREELYFSNEHIPITRVTLETGQKILAFLQTAEPHRWQYATENCLKSALENIFTLISEVMFYETGHYGETSLHLLYTYHDTRYYANVATCAAQIINFFKEETRKIQIRNHPPPPDFPKPGPSNPRSNQDGEEDDGNIDLTNPFLAPMIGAMIRGSMQPSTSGNTRNNSNLHRIPTTHVGDLTIINETKEFTRNSEIQHRGRCSIKTGTTADASSIKTGTLNHGNPSESSDEKINSIMTRCGGQQFMSEYEFWKQPNLQTEQGPMKCLRNGNLNLCFFMENRNNENCNLAVAQTENLQNTNEPDHHVLENLKHFMGPGLYNLADAYTNMMLLDSVIANKQFIRLFGLDRILNEGEIKAVTQESAGTDDFKYYRQSAHDKMKTIPVNMFDLSVTENAIVAYMQSHQVNQNAPNAGETSSSNAQNTNHGFFFIL